MAFNSEKFRDRIKEITNGLDQKIIDAGGLIKRYASNNILHEIRWPSVNLIQKAWKCLDDINETDKDLPAYDKLEVFLSTFLLIRPSNVPRREELQAGLNLSGNIFNVRYIITQEDVMVPAIPETSGHIFCYIPLELSHIHKEDDYYRWYMNYQDFYKIVNQIFWLNPLFKNHPLANLDPEIIENIIDSLSQKPIVEKPSMKSDDKNWIPPNQ